MNKSELIEAVASDCDISKAAAQRAVDSTLETITQALADGEDVTLVGFGTFSVAERAESKGLNAQTKQAITIPATKAPKFKAGKLLKQAVK
ncbi:MAG: HU family DNA-binding protein [Burkholderiales bacterium]|nr:HU family DNA-binding protein [Burkholderiales bacterium]